MALYGEMVARVRPFAGYLELEKEVRWVRLRGSEVRPGPALLEAAGVAVQVGFFLSICGRRISKRDAIQQDCGSLDELRGEHEITWYLDIPSATITRQRAVPRVPTR